MDCRNEVENLSISTRAPKRERQNNNNNSNGSTTNTTTTSSTNDNTDKVNRPTRFPVRSHYFLPGDIVWIRPPGLPYWPAEVITPPENTDNNTKKNNKSTITARLFDPPASLLSDTNENYPPRFHITAAATKVYFFDRLQTPEEIEEMIEQRLQRTSHNVSEYEGAFQRALLHANRLVRTIFTPERLRPQTICGVGIVYSLMRTHISAPRQPQTAEFIPQTAVIKLRNGLENAVRDLSGFEYIWVLFSFSYSVVEEGNRPVEEESKSQQEEKEEKHQQGKSQRQGVEKSFGFKTMLIPPRDTELRGVFATRSPHRPNFIGLSCVKLVAVRGLEVHIADHDLLHGTPVLDIKPYLPFCDAHPQAKAGWVEALDASGRGRGDHKSDTQRVRVDRVFEEDEGEMV